MEEPSKVHPIGGKDGASARSPLPEASATMRFSPRKYGFPAWVLKLW